MCSGHDILALRSHRPTQKQLSMDERLLQALSLETTAGVLSIITIARMMERKINTDSGSAENNRGD